MNSKIQISPEVVRKVLKDLEKAVHNPRTHSQKQIQKLANCIERFGFTQPVLIDANNTIVAGHGRYEAAKLLGLKEIPVIVLEHLSEEELKAYMIADNKLAELSQWDEDLLKLDLEELITADFDLSFTGFDTPEIDLLVSDNYTEKKKSKKTEEIKDYTDIESTVNPGDIYQIGKHLMICGDALNQETYEALMGEDKAQMVFTDPPYNVKINGHVCKSGKHDEFAFASGEMSDEEFTDFLNKPMLNLAAYSTDGSIHFYCMDWRHSEHILQASKGVYSELKNICVWDKGTGGMGSLYRSQHEFIYVFKNGTAPHCNNVELGKHGRYRTNLWQYPGVRASNPDSLELLKLHPTVKPVSMVMDAILDCSKQNDIILDAFAGSGTTLLAAQRTKRRARVIELDPHYCDIILVRYIEQFGKDNVKFIRNIKREA